MACLLEYWDNEQLDMLMEPTESLGSWDVTTFARASVLSSVRLLVASGLSISGSVDVTALSQNGAARSKRDFNAAIGLWVFAKHVGTADLRADF